MSYDFYHAFSPTEFQNFARDIIQIKEHIILESFAEGRDMGIDGRYVAKDGYTIIFQAKRIKNAGDSIMKIMRTERTKMDKLLAKGKRVDRYILAIADNITVRKKDEIYRLMSPYIVSTDDILMKEDLNNLLSQKEYQKVEDKYYQLWIPSANILRKQLFRMVNSALVQKSITCYEEILKKREVFVETSVFKDAVMQLRKNRVIIISGEPGVGKTTLAQQLSLYYFAKYQFQAFLSVSSVDELYAALEMEGKKVIFYDDFWGSNGFDTFGSGRQSGELVTFIDRIRRHKDCLLVMTTREYILEQGLEQNEELRRLVKDYELECRVEQYSDAEKLRIYYGHLKSSCLTWEQTRELQSNYFSVIYSPNYNPRVIELFTKHIKPDMPAEKCVAEFDEYIRCPHEFWKKIFHDLSDEAKILYVLTLIFPMPIEMHYLEKSYNDEMKARADKLEWKNFSDAVIELEKTVIRTDRYKRGEEGLLTITYQNPSARDFLIALVKENIEKYHITLFRNCQYYSQYVEYLKILDDINAPEEIYGEVYRSAVHKINSDSILFYDKYKMILQYHQEIHKLSERFETEQNYRDIGFGRIFQLILMYKKGCGEPVKTILAKFFVSVMRDIERYPELVLSEDLRMVPDVIVAVYKNRICEKTDWMLDVYFNSMMRNREPINDTRLREALPHIWKKYVERKRETIAAYLEKYYEAELCLAAAQGDGEEFDYQLFQCEEDFEEYGLTIPEELNEKIGLYDTWVSGSEEEIEFPEEDYGSNGQSMEDIHREFKEDFLNLILPTPVEDVKQWMERRAIPSKVKEILKRINEEGHIFWEDFLHDEGSLEFMESFIKCTGDLPEELEDIFKEVARYIEEKSGLNKEMFLEFAAGLEKLTKNDKSWSEAEVNEIYSDIIFENEDFLEKMAEANIVVHRYHWYRFVNTLLAFCVKFVLYRSDSAERKKYYLSVKERARNQEVGDKDWRFWLSLKILDPSYYEKYILAPSMHDLYEQLTKTGKPWLDALIEYFSMTHEFKDYDLIGGECAADFSYDILGTYLDVELMDFLTPEFSDKQIQILRRKELLRKEKQTVTLRELKENGLLEEFGIYENLEKLWKEISRWQTEVQYEE